MKTIKKIAFYILTPVAFICGGYLLMYIALSPVIKTLGAVGGMLIQNNSPNFDSELSVIYDPVAHTKVTTPTVNLSDIQFPEQGDQYAQIECNDIELNAPVYWGDTNRILNAGVGQYMGSFLPGYGRTILLAAHNTTYFYCLKDAQKDMIVTITTNYGKYEYKIDDIQVIAATDAEKMSSGWLSATQEQLIMYTCYPFDGGYGEKADRYFIFASKISGPELE